MKAGVSIWTGGVERQSHASQAPNQIIARSRGRWDGSVSHEGSMLQYADVPKCKGHLGPVGLTPSRHDLVEEAMALDTSAIDVAVSRVFSGAPTAVGKGWVPDWQGLFHFI